MKLAEKIKKYFHRKTWWRKDFRKVYITEREALDGRCILCHAGTESKGIPQCCRGKTTALANTTNV